MSDEVVENVHQHGQQGKNSRPRRGDDRSDDKKRFKREHKVQEFKPRLDENGNPVPKSERRPKKKVAVMMGYCGTGYNGMQIQTNPNVKTIENDLFKAFVNAGAISQDNSDDLKKNGFMRAARTDKGVHAAGNVVSCKLIIEDSDILDKINKELPDQIRVWGIERVNKSFDCRKMCSSRIYEYLLPTYSLLPPKPQTVLAKLISKSAQESSEALRDDSEGDQWWEETKKAILEAGLTEDDLQKAQELLEKQNQNSDQSQQETSEPKESTQLYDSDGNITENGKLIRSIKQIENKRRRAYKVSTERLNLLREALQNYEGSHNFHNFTVGKTFKDPSARRYMKKLTVSDPFVIEGTEWVSIKIHGQSFMLHQIRKMIAMAVLVIRTRSPLSRIQDAFGPTKINIPKAPALGLLLEAPVYEGINGQLEKFGYNPIEFSKYQEVMDAFKMKYIYDKIYAEEVRENVFYGFFGFIDTFEGNGDTKEGRHIFDFLGAKYIESESLKENRQKSQRVSNRKNDVSETKQENEVSQPETKQENEVSQPETKQENEVSQSETKQENEVSQSDAKQEN